MVANINTSLPPQMPPLPTSLFKYSKALQGENYNNYAPPPSVGPPLAPPMPMPPLPNVPALPALIGQMLAQGVQPMPHNSPPPQLAPSQPLANQGNMPTVVPPNAQQLPNVPAILPSRDPSIPSFGAMMYAARTDGVSPALYAQQAILNSGTYKGHLANLLGQGLPLDVAQARASALTVSSNPDLQALYKTSQYENQDRSVDAAYDQNAMNWSSPLGDPSIYTNANANDPFSVSPLQGATQSPDGGIDIQAANGYYHSPDSWRTLAGAQAQGPGSIYDQAMRFEQQRRIAEMQALNREYQARALAQSRRDQANIQSLGKILSSMSRNLPEESRKAFEGIMAQYNNATGPNSYNTPPINQQAYPPPMYGNYGMPLPGQIPNPYIGYQQVPYPNFGEPF